LAEFHTHLQRLCGTAPNPSSLPVVKLHTHTHIHTHTQTHRDTQRDTYTHIHTHTHTHTHTQVCNAGLASLCTMYWALVARGGVDVVMCSTAYVPLCYIFCCITHSMFFAQSCVFFLASCVFICSQSIVTAMSIYQVWW
jgi:hypothetical protein